MTDEHKAALAEGGRKAGPSGIISMRSRPQSPSGAASARRIPSRSASTQSRLSSKRTDPLKALNLRQERRNLYAELAGMDDKVDLAGVEKEFVAAAKAYGQRRGISYEVWREAGVPSDVLKKAGITRGS